MENVLQCFEGGWEFQVFIIIGSSSEGHLQTLDKVLTKIGEAMLKFNRPLYKLLQNHTRWKWPDNQEDAFQLAKQAIGSCM